MSYDLLFTDPAPSDAASAFAGYFEARRDYELQGTQAWYANPDTGVYFAFELSGPHDDAFEETDEPASWACFNLNYCRPRIFASEAELELQAFVEHFGCRVFDPQIDGIGEGVFSADAFRAGWSAGNTLARRATNPSGDASEVIVRPAEELERIWRWNYGRRSLQQQLGDEIFVPRISFFRVAGRVCSASVWTDGIPVLLPKTEIVILYRDELAPRRWFRRKPGPAVAPWDAAMSQLDPSHRGNEPLPHYLPKNAFDSDAVATWIRSLNAADQLQPVSVDAILDSEDAA